MANERRGYIPIELDKPRTLHFDFNSFCEMEMAFGKFYYGSNAHGSPTKPMPIYEILDKFFTGKHSVNDLKLMLWGGLIFEEPTLKVEDMPQILRGINFAQIYQQIMKAVQAVMPEEEAKAKEGNSHVPPEQTETETQTASIGGTSSE